MKQFLALTWVQFKMHMGISELLYALHGSKKDKLRGIGYIALTLFLCCTLVGIVSFLMDALFAAAMVPLFQQTVLAVFILAAMIVVLLFGIFYAISLYYAKDNEFLMSLPLGKYTAFASKFMVALIGEIGTFALIIVPALVVFSLHAQIAPSFFIKGLLVVMLGPFIPFALANLLAAVMMRVTAISRHKDKIAILGGFALMIGYLFLNQYLSASLATMDSYDIQVLLGGGLIQAVTAAFPPARWAAMALVYNDSRALSGLLLFLGISALAFFLCIFAAGRMYQKSAAAQGETYQKNKRAAVSKLGGKVKTPVRSIFIKEWKILLRSPIYAMNALTGVVLAPLMIAILVVTPINGPDGGMNGLLSLLQTNQTSGLFILVGAGYCYFMATLNTACMTMYSREGEALWLTLVVPVKAKVFYNGKLLCAVSISLLCALAAAIAFILILSIGAWTALAAALLGLLACAPALLMMLYVDMVWPHLHWDSERKAIKSNINAFLGILIAFVFGPILGFASYWFTKIGLTLTAGVLVLTAACLILTAAVYTISIRKAQKLLERMAER